MVCDPSEFEPCCGNGTESGSSNLLNNGSAVNNSGVTVNNNFGLILPANGRWSTESVFEGCRLRVEMTNSKQFSKKNFFNLSKFDSF